MLRVFTIVHSPYQQTKASTCQACSSGNGESICSAGDARWLLCSVQLPSQCCLIAFDHKAQNDGPNMYFLLHGLLKPYATSNEACCRLDYGALHLEDLPSCCCGARLCNKPYVSASP